LGHFIYQSSQGAFLPAGLEGDGAALDAAAAGVLFAGAGVALGVELPEFGVLKPVMIF